MLSKAINATHRNHAPIGLLIVERFACRNIDSVLVESITVRIAAQLQRHAWECVRRRPSILGRRIAAGAF
jgi:hypothetical protein